MIYTSYFANIKNIPEGIIPISICGKAPDWYTGLQYKKLAPKYSFFMAWKENKDNDYYIRHFNSEVLGGLIQRIVVKELYDLAKSNQIVLLCYEKPSDFCHRHLVADWLEKDAYGCMELSNKK